jgi:hypothetical protein
VVNKVTIDGGTVDNKVLYWGTLDWGDVGNFTGLCTRKVLMLMVSYVILHYDAEKFYVFLSFDYPD